MDQKIKSQIENLPDQINRVENEPSLEVKESREDYLKGRFRLIKEYLEKNPDVLLQHMRNFLFVNNTIDEESLKIKLDDKVYLGDYTFIYNLNLDQSIRNFLIEINEGLPMSIKMNSIIEVKQHKLIDLFLFYDSDLFSFYWENITNKEYGEKFRNLIKGTDFKERFIKDAKEKLIDCFNNKEDISLIIKVLGDELDLQVGDLEYNSNNFEYYLNNFLIIKIIFKKVGIYDQFLAQIKEKNIHRLLEENKFDLLFNIIQISEIELDESMIQALGLDIIDGYDEVKQGERMKNFQRYWEYKKEIFGFREGPLGQDQGNLVIYYRNNQDNDMTQMEFKAMVTALNMYIENGKSLIFSKLAYVLDKLSRKLSIEEEELFDIKCFDVRGKEFQALNKKNDLINSTHGSPPDIVKEEQPVITIIPGDTLKDLEKMIREDNNLISENYIKRYIIPFKVHFYQNGVKDLQRYKEVIQETIRVVRELEERYIKLFEKEKIESQKLAN